jgi:starch synthase
MRFGTIPVVRAIGGLKDTVNDISNKSGNGFLFANPSIEDFVKAVERALEFYKEPSRKNKLRKSNMELDYSWKKSSEKYNRVYDLLIDKL